jgi:hypothetical protein
MGELLATGWTWDQLAQFGAVVFFIALVALVACEWWKARGAAERRRWS